LFFAYCKTTNILTGTSFFISVVAFKDWHRHLLHGLSQSLIQVGWMSIKSFGYLQTLGLI